MYLVPIELLSQAHLAEYERGVARMRLEREALAVAHESREQNRPLRRTPIWWALTRRTQRPAF